MAPMDGATALHKRNRKGALIFTFLTHIYSLFRFGPNFAVKLRSCRSKLLTSIPWETWNLTSWGVTWGDVNLIPRQNMRCGEKRVEIATFRRGLLRIEVRSFTWLRRSSPRRKERFRVSSGDDLPKTLVCNLMHKGTLQISHKSRLLFCQLLILNLIEKQTRSIFKMYMSRPTKKGELSR